MALSGPQRTVATTVGVVVVMASLGFASVPLYDLFCRVTGFGGVTQEADAGSDVILERTIKIRFDASIDAGMPWNVFPYEAGGYFTKIDCFCFTEQVLQPGETVQMPLTFYVDPEMVDDRDAKHVQTITLGYTFYETELPEQQAQLATDQAKDVN